MQHLVKNFLALRESDNVLARFANGFISETTDKKITRYPPQFVEFLSLMVGQEVLEMSLWLEHWTTR
jgi:hypothetical protein